MTCSTSYCLCNTLLDPRDVHMYLYICMYIYMYVCMYVNSDLFSETLWFILKLYISSVVLKLWLNKKVLISFIYILS